MAFKYSWLESYANLPGLNSKNRAKVVELCLKFEVALDELEKLHAQHGVVVDHEGLQEKADEAEKAAPVLAEQIHQESAEQRDLPVPGGAHGHGDSPVKKKKKQRHDN